MIGAPDALSQTAGSFGCTDMDYQINAAPVNAQIEGGCAHYGAQGPRCHGRFDLAPSLARQRSVMQGYFQIIMIDRP